MVLEHMLSPLDFFNNKALREVQNKEYCAQLLALNEQTSERGVVLSEADAKDLIETRNKSLADNERIEVGVGIAAKIVDKFSQSSFVNQLNYAETLNDLLELFYFIKTEAKDKISDTDLLNMMWWFFENRCYGSMEIMTGREMEILLRYIKEDRTDYTLDETDDYGAEPEIPYD